MADPTITSATKDDTSGSITAGVYKVTVVGVDPAGGVTMYPTALSVTAAGGTSHIDVVYVAPTGGVSTRVYVTDANGATPDRYFVSTSATTYTLTTVAGAMKKRGGNVGGAESRKRRISCPQSGSIPLRRLVFTFQFPLVLPRR
ncbi:MAG: hypothetical protein V2B18_26080 [Pseudomonadota bacterium]